MTAADYSPPMDEKIRRQGAEPLVEGYGLSFTVLL